MRCERANEHLYPLESARLSSLRLARQTDSQTAAARKVQEARREREREREQKAAGRKSIGWLQTRLTNGRRVCTELGPKCPIVSARWLAGWLAGSSPFGRRLSAK